jgi:hypothetical protein
LEAEYRTELAAIPATLASTSENLGLPFNRAAELSEVAGKIVVLEGVLADNDDADNVESHDLPVIVPMDVLRQLLTTDSKGNPLVRWADMNPGDVVSGVGKAGLWEVAHDEELRKVLIPQGKTLEDGDDRMGIDYSKEYPLISRPLKNATVMERAAMDVTGFDDIVRGPSKLEPTQRIRLFGRFLENGSEQKRYNVEPENLAGIVVGGETPYNEHAIRLEDGREGTFKLEGYRSPIIRYGVRDPQKELALMAAEAQKTAERDSFTLLRELLPGDVVSEDIPEIGVKAGDVATAGFGVVAFRDPDTGAQRPQPVYKYTARALNWRPGREVTPEEMNKLFPEGAAQTAGTLRVGDRLVSTDLNKKATLTNDVVITAVSGGPLIAFSYRDASDAKATQQDCKRKDDQAVTVLGRRYGALTDLELLRLAVPTSEYANVDLTDPRLLATVMGVERANSRNLRNELLVGTLVSSTSEMVSRGWNNDVLETTLQLRVIDEIETITLRGETRDIVKLPDGMKWATLDFTGLPQVNELFDEPTDHESDDVDEALWETMQVFAREANAETAALLADSPETVEPGSPEWKQAANEVLDRRTSPLDEEDAKKLADTALRSQPTAPTPERLGDLQNGPTATTIGLGATIVNSAGERFTVMSKEVKELEIWIDLRNIQTKKVMSLQFGHHYPFKLAQEEPAVDSGDWRPDPPSIGIE